MAKLVTEDGATGTIRFFLPECACDNIHVMHGRNTMLTNLRNNFMYGYKVYIKSMVHLCYPNLRNFFFILLVYARQNYCKIFDILLF